MKIGVIADDLTGANSTGVRLKDQGLASATIMYNANIPTSSQFNAICIDTDSRYLQRNLIQERVTSATEKLQNWGSSFISKRIDSTFRGNIGVEIDTVLTALGEDSFAIVVASFPESNRITSGGYLLVDSIPLQESDVGQDNLMPLTQSFLPAILQEQSEYLVGYIGLGDVLIGKARLEQKINENIKKGNRIILMDAINNENIEEIAKSMAVIQSKESVPIIPVDPGPLTAFYANALLKRTIERNKVIVTVGSVTTKTEKQLHYLMNKTNSFPVYVFAEKLASFGLSWEKEVNRAFQDALKKIQKNEILIITTYEGRELINLKEKSRKEKTTEQELAKRITGGLAEVTRLLIKQCENTIKGCFTSGGDVTASLVSITASIGIELKNEISPLIAYGTLIGGCFSGLPIITKGGMIGNEQAIYTSVKYLQLKGVG